MANWRFSGSTANWSGIMAKAQRLRMSDDVDVEQQQEGYVAGIVQGDHGTYNVQIKMSDPYSGIIDEWHCDCPWFQYAWNRTEKYKKLEGRFCSHALALYWQSQATPEKTPEEAVPEEERDEPKVEKEEEKWEMQELEEEPEIAEEPQKVAPLEVQEPKIFSEVMPPAEPVAEEPSWNLPAEQVPANEWEFPQQTEETIPTDIIRNASVSNTKYMHRAKYIKDLLKFYKDWDGDDG